MTDARIQKHADCFLECGWDVLLIGRSKKNSLPLPREFYKSIRFAIRPEKGVFFYLIYQIRLLWFLMKSPKPRLYFSNDTDTLLPVFIASKIKKVPFFFDSHELFWEVPELEGKPLKKWIWSKIEQICIPSAEYCFTVNQSISEILSKRFGKVFHVIRNIPREYPETGHLPETRDKISHILSKTSGRKILIYQGSGINIQRGLEEMMEAMVYLKNEFALLLVGGGDVWYQLKSMAKEKNLTDDVIFIDKVPRPELIHFTKLAHAGLSLDKPVNTNYINSLPNKVFDYIHAGIPLITTDIKQISSLVIHYGIGKILSSLQPEILCREIQSFMQSGEYDVCKQNVILAKKELNWNTEKQKLTEIIKTLS
ncbi:MAG: glycosyltransferase [Bacteroidia bacterium]|nr:glycosyltransferase [Bacteroidia bacterium]